MAITTAWGRPITLIWLLLSPLIACGDSAAGTPTPEEALSCDRSPPLTYESFGQAFMIQNCTPCHHVLLPEADRNGAPVGVDFETYGKVLSWSDRIHERTVVTETMPPGGGLSAEDLSKFEEWLGCEVAGDKAALEGDDGSGGEDD